MFHILAGICIITSVLVLSYIHALKTQGVAWAVLYYLTWLIGIGLYLLSVRRLDPFVLPFGVLMVALHFLVMFERNNHKG